MLKNHISRKCMDVASVVRSLFHHLDSILVSFSQFVRHWFLHRFGNMFIDPKYLPKSTHWFTVFDHLQRTIRICATLRCDLERLESDPAPNDLQNWFLHTFSQLLCNAPSSHAVRNSKIWKKTWILLLCFNQWKINHFDMSKCCFCYWGSFCRCVFVSCEWDLGVGR